MSGSIKLDGLQKHLLSLIVQDADAEGWAAVGSFVFPSMAAMPFELVELERVGNEGRGRARLTAAGQHVIDAMAWIGDAA